MEMKTPQTFKFKTVEKEGKKEQKGESKTTEVGEFIDCLLVSAVIVHKHHLKVKGMGAFEIHTALNDLYEALPDFGDQLCEKYQGFYGVIVDTKECMSQEVYLKMTPLQFVDWLLEYVNNYRKVFGTNTMLQNIVDELVAGISKTRYKLLFLS